MLRIAILTAALALASPLSAQSSADEPAPLVKPSVDHHQHLLSSAGAGSRLATILLPPSIKNVLVRREAAWNSRVDLLDAFAPDATLFLGETWVEGRSGVAENLYAGYTGPYRFKPVSYRVEGPRAEVSGFLVEDNPAEAHFGFFNSQFTNTGGRWLISRETQIFPGPSTEKTLSADELIAQMDQAGIERSVVLSDAYYFDAWRPYPVTEEEDYPRVKAENDWTAEQVRPHANRLAAFCSFNPLKSYALAELQRCRESGAFKGVKIHLNGAQIKFGDAGQVEQLRTVFRAADAARLPLIVHVRPGRQYGATEAQGFLNVLASAPNVPIQVAHLWGGEDYSAEALDVFADAVERGVPGTKNLYFDISGLAAYSSEQDAAAITATMRRIGLNRMLYGSDGPPVAAWRSLKARLPLTEAEFELIARNVAPYWGEP